MATYVAIFGSADEAKKLAAEFIERGIRSEEIGVYGPGDDTQTPEAQDFLSGVEKRAAAAITAGDTVMVARAAVGLGRVIEEGFEKTKPKRSFAKRQGMRHASDLIGLGMMSRRRPFGYLPTGTLSGLLPLSVKGHMDPVLPLSAKGQMDPVLPHTTKGHMDPVLPLSKKGRTIGYMRPKTLSNVLPMSVKGHMDPVLPLTKKGHMDPVLPLSKKGHIDPILPLTVKGHIDPILPHSLKGIVDNADHMDQFLPLLTKDRTHFSMISLIFRQR